MSPRKLVGAGTLLLFVLSLATSASAQTKVIAEGDSFSYFKGMSEPPSDWNTLAFDDSSWLDGITPFGYGDLTNGTVLSDMQNGYLTLYIRRKFTIADANNIGALTLRMRYDDGYVAYINGVEIVRKNVAGTPGTPPAFDAPGTDHETNPTFEDTLICRSALTSLVSGENVLAIQGHNVNLTSSDFTLFPVLESVNDLCPINMMCIPSPAGNPVNMIVRWTKPTPTFAFSTISLLRNGTPVTGTVAPGATSFTDRNVPAGTYTYQLVTEGCGVACASPPTCTGTIGTGGGETFRRGDTDGNGSVNVTDAVTVLNALFQGATFPACPDTADTDDTGDVSITDAVFLLNALFQGGLQPPAPGIDACGPDPTADELGPCTYTAC
jgi:hypothetical protein